MSIHNHMHSDKREDQGYVAKCFVSKECKNYVANGPNIDKDLTRLYNATLYNKNGAAKAIGGTVAINSLDHFVVKKYIPDDLKEVSPLVSWGLCRYILFPAIESLSKK